VLLDHIFIISAGEITRGARTWLIENLDTINGDTSFLWIEMSFSVFPRAFFWIFRLKKAAKIDSGDVPF
jgi:hypothetical protein